MNPPFPYFGGKRRAAASVWRALGPVSRYVEPFFGSGAVLLASPHLPASELVNDSCGYVANFWRAMQNAPGEVKRYTAAPADEVELRARHAWLFHGEGRDRIGAVDWADLSSCDPEVAGIWAWCASVSINPATANLRRSPGLPGVKSSSVDLDAISERVRDLQISRGDWSRCVTPAALGLPRSGNAPTGMIGVFLGPPYGEGNGVAYEDGSGLVARDVRAWAIENGDNHRLRIVVAGYDSVLPWPEGWTTIRRVEKGGYGGKGRARERLWCSPHCLHTEQLALV